MTDKPDPSPADALTTLAAMGAEMVQATTQAAIGLFEAEVAALQHAVAPAAEPETPQARQAREKAEAAAIEDGFDNMPV